MSLIRTFLDELEWSATRKYVEHLRGRDELLVIGPVDVDVPQIVQRHFVCDARRCIQWAGDRALIDRSCCCRYGVPLTARDRQAIEAHLVELRSCLPTGHRLIDPEAAPFKQDEELGWEMVHDNPLGGCQFNIYTEGRCRCLLHAAAIEHGDNPLDWKPLACSLWPLAINDYDEDGETRFLLTVYCEQTAELFDDVDDETFACIEDQDPSYPQLFQAEQAVLSYIFGAEWYGELARRSRAILGER